MPARATVFCRDSIQHITAQNIQQMIDAIEDLYMVAEHYGVEEDEVDTALPFIRVEAWSDNSLNCTLHYREASQRQIDIELITDLTMVRETIQEEISLGYAQGCLEISDRLQACSEIVYLEYSISAIATIGEVLACETALWLAHQGDGVVHLENGTWWLADNDGNWFHLYTDE